MRWLRSLRVILATLVVWTPAAGMESFQARSWFLDGGLAILGPQRMWVRGVSLQGTWGLVSKIPGWRLERDHGVRGMINSQAVLFHVSDEGSMEACQVLIWVLKQSSLAEWSRQSILVESLIGAQNSLALLSGQDSLSLSSSYLGLKAVQPYRVVKTVHSCWVLIWVSKQSSPAEWSKQSIPVEFLSGFQSSPALLSGQDSPSLSCLYLGLKTVQPCRALSGGLDSSLPSLYHWASYSS